MNILIQRKSRYLFAFAVLAILMMSCWFMGSEAEPDTGIKTETSTVLETVVLSEDPIAHTATPFQPISTSTPVDTLTQLYPPDPKPLPVFDSSRLGQMDHDAIYCVAEDGTELKMDVHYPETETGPWPVMLYIHGGGWSSGHKGSQSFFPDFTALGLLGVTIDYRLSPDVLFPAHIEDVKCAVRHLRANAEHYNLDPDRIMAVGGSAGAHLASLLGTTGDSGEFNIGQYRNESSAVQAVVALSAPTDLINWGCSKPEEVEAYYHLVFGSDAQCGEYDPLLEDASPITYVSSQDVPFLFVAGTADEVVPYQQSEAMHAALLKVGVSSQLQLVEGAGHDLQVPGHPDREEEALRVIIEFTLEQLHLPWPDWLEKE